MSLPASNSSERQRVWRERGLPEEDARDLVLFADADDEDAAASRLEAGRQSRQALVSALEEGLGRRHVAALVLAAELAASRDGASARLLAELLADAALAAANPPAEALRHRSVGGRLAEIAARLDPAALREAALAAADPPPDNRRGNRRLHFEKVLLDLYGAAGRQA